MTIEIARIGDVIARKYRVDGIVGVGGMGLVVAATHLELGRKVALKFMLPATFASNEASTRFLGEARAAGSLRNEHICRVVDLGRLDTGAPYIVMEYMEGYDLGAVTKQSRVCEVGDAVDCILQACEGIAEAHRKGIVHRDLKPENVFVTRRSCGAPLVKVLDFGISKLALGGAGATATCDLLGSPAYMAPEQIESTRDVDPRADIWSLGVILYQLVTGVRPFDADTLPALCVRVLDDPPLPLHALRTGLPRGFSGAVMRCLEKDRDDRYADVGELAEALAPYGHDDSRLVAERIAAELHPTRARPSFAAAEPIRVESRRSLTRSVGVLLIVLALGVLAFVVALNSAPERRRDSAAPPPVIQPGSIRLGV